MVVKQVEPSLQCGQLAQSGRAAELGSCLRSLASAAGSVDVSSLAEAEVISVLGHLRRVQRCLDGLVIQLGTRATAFAETGQAGSPEETLRGGGDVGARQAKREAARTKLAVAYPEVEAAVSSGRITGEHVDAVARHLAKLPEADRAKLAVGEILAKAEQLPVETFDRFMRRQVDEATGDHGLSDMMSKQQASEFRHWFDDRTGMGRFAGALDPERYEVLVNAVEQQTTDLAGRDGKRLTANLAAAALVDLVSQAGPAGGGRRPSITVVVDHDTMMSGGHRGSVRQTENGRNLPPETVARLCCDATIRRVTLDRRGVPVNVGRTHRTATGAQWAALKTMYTSCAWEGCTAPVSWCQAHHIHEWEQGGATDLDNLVPLCTIHHHRVHEGRWQIKLLVDRTLEIYRPNGSHHTTVQPPMRC